MSGNTRRLLPKEPNRSKQLINGVRPHKAFRTASRHHAVGTTWYAYLYLLRVFALPCELPAWRLASSEFALQGLHFARPALHQSSSSVIEHLRDQTHPRMTVMVYKTILLQPAKSGKGTDDHEWQQLSIFRDTSTYTWFSNAWPCEMSDCACASLNGVLLNSAPSSRAIIWEARASRWLLIEMRWFSSWI